MSEVSSVDRYAFIAEWFDNEASLLKKFYLFFFPFDQTLELFDIKNHRTFLKRTQCQGVTLNELFVGNAIEIFSRQMKITDYADELTKKKMKVTLQKTFALLKPDGVSKMGSILRMINNSCFKISKLKMVQFTPEQAENFYAEHAGQSFLPYLIAHLASGPTVGMELVAENAIQKMRDLVGNLDPVVARAESPQSIRACFAVSKNLNVIHCSDSLKAVTEESEIVFPSDPGNLVNAPKTTAKFENSTCCVVKPCAVKDGKLAEIVSLIQENKYEITAMQMFYLDHDSASEFYEVYKGVVSEYSAMVNHLISGPCVAIEVCGPPDVNTPVEFRKLVGPTDPDIARQLRPETIRARYGINKVQNAVHVTDLPEDANLEVQYFFKIMTQICT